MKKKNILIGVFLLIGLVAIFLLKKQLNTSGSAADDFHFICKTYESLLNDLKQEKADVPTLYVNTSKKLEEGIKSYEVKKAIEAISVASNESKYELYKETANYLGVKNWDCPAIPELFQGTPSN